jgi:DNA uptake protein ComE-like DNA-binding protein
MGGAVLITTVMLFVAAAEVASAGQSAEAAAARGLAWSGIQAAMSRLEEDRREILQGRLPRIDERFEIVREGRSLGVARLLPLGPDGERFVAESALLDLNRADAARLAATDLIDPDLAQRIVAARARRPGARFASVAELLFVEGVDAEMLYGPVADLADPAARAFGASEGRRLGAARGPRGLADFLTVHAQEPALQQNGRLRINLNVPWSEDLGRRIDDRFGEGAGEIIRGIIDGGTTFDSEAKIFQALRFFNVDPRDWPEIIDALTTEAGEYHFGRLDINAAPYEALRALPGLEAGQAAEMVRVREDLTAEDSATIAWPAIQGILRPQQYDELASWMTTRAWTYRLRMEAGWEDAEAGEATLRGRVVYEAVIDLSGPQPRVAYLRDVTLLNAAAALCLELPPPEPQEPLRGGGADDRAPEPAAGDGAPDAGQEPLPARRRIGRWLRRYKERSWRHGAPSRSTWGGADSARCSRAEAAGS